MISKIFSTPIKIFLIDALGAFATAFIIGVVFTHFQEYIGLPQELLMALASVAVIFCIYSLSCYLFLKKNWTPYLKAIVLGNLLYCIITAVLIIALFHQLTILGLVYFIGEIILIGVLVYIEYSILIRS